LTVNGTQSEFYSGLVNKVFSESKDNPFQAAYEEDIKHNVYSATHFNYEFMKEIQVQNTVIKLMIECIIKFKLVVSARSFLNFLVDILVVEDLTPYKMLDDFYKIENSVPLLLFNRKDRSFILRHMYLLNPSSCMRSKHVDQLTIDLNTLNNVEEVVCKHISNPKGRELLTSLSQEKELENAPFLKFAEAVILTAYLTNENFCQSISDPLYDTYIYRLFGFNTFNIEIVKDIFNDVKESVFKWKVSPRKDYIYLAHDQPRFRMAQKLIFKPSTSHIFAQKGNVLDNFNDKLIVSYYLGETKTSIELEIDYALFKLITIIMKGYIPNKQDYDDSLKFLEFMEKIMNYGSKNKELLVHLESENKIYSLSVDDFHGYIFEKESL
jgi:DNA phosphorothioation-dependent restriction protein DptF